MIKIILYYVNKLLYYIFKFQLFFIIKLTQFLKKYTNIKIFKNKTKSNCGNTLNGILLCIFYIPVFIYIKSSLFLLTIINSIIYHIIHQTKLEFKYIDIGTNIISLIICFIISIYYKCHFSTFLIIIGSINFIYFSKSKLYIKNKISGILAHSFLVQYIYGFAGIIMYLNNINIP